MIENVILVLFLLAIAAGIIWYLVRAKRRGAKCVGCPYANRCNGNCSSTGTMQTEEKSKND